LPLLRGRRGRGKAKTCFRPRGTTTTSGNKQATKLWEKKIYKGPSTIPRLLSTNGRGKTPRDLILFNTKRKKRETSDLSPRRHLGEKRQKKGTRGGWKQNCRKKVMSTGAEGGGPWLVRPHHQLTPSKGPTTSSYLFTGGAPKAGDLNYEMDKKVRREN